MIRGAELQILGCFFFVKSSAFYRNASQCVLFFFFPEKELKEFVGALRPREGAEGDSRAVAWPHNPPL